jgi:L-threonylcarbamoyladenylate synthase
LGKGVKKASIITWNTGENLQAAVSKARDILLSGGIVAFPTESFYGLAVDISNGHAVQRLFAMKERPKDRPILLLIPSTGSLDRYVDPIPSMAQKLMDRFWPGGLTLVFHAKNTVSPILTAGTGKIGIRLSDHPVAVALAKAVEAPITGTSANVSGQPPCSTAEDVYRELGERIDLILDGGKTIGSRGSTIVDVTQHPPVILRQGIIGREQLHNVIDALI